MKVISRTDYPILKLNDKSVGALAQLVEQWTENPCVPGSIPGGTTKTSSASRRMGSFFMHSFGED